MARTGRPPKYCTELAEKLLVHLSYGCPRKMAAEVEGTSEAAIYRWMQEKPDFREAVLAAEARARASLVACLQKQARNGSTKAAAWLLERLAPREFAPPAQQIDLDVNIAWEALDDADLERLATGAAGAAAHTGAGPVRIAEKTAS